MLHRRRAAAARRGSALHAGLFWLVGLLLLGAPFLGQRDRPDPEGDDPGRLVSETDIPFDEDVADFEDEFSLPLGDRIAEESEARLALDSPVLLATGLVRVERVPAGRRAFERHCIGCHGSIGDGGGPGAAHLKPRPRNFRKGVFKFTSTESGARPRREDLFQTVTRGLAGSSMPSFRLLPEETRWDLVEYVRYLALRGEFEQTMLDWAWTDEELPDAGEVFETVLDRWSEHKTRAVYPPIPETPNDAESVARGRALFLDTSKAGCVNCHGPTGVGDGPSAGDFHDFWGYPIRPRDLTSGLFRAGGSSADLYRSISTGINGTPMTSFSIFEPEQIWDLVHFVQSLNAQGATR